MTVTVEPGRISGSITAPPSKSHTQRVYAAALLHKGTTLIKRAGNSDDEQAALNIIRQLGAVVRVEYHEGVPRVCITSEGVNPISGNIDCGESGLCARLFTPIAALSERAITITGSGTLLARPMDGFVDTLPLLNVSLPDFKGALPLTVRGPLKAKSMSMNAGDGSQFLSGLLFALSYAAKEGISLDVVALKSKPYVDLTLDVLQQFGKPIKNENYQRFLVNPALFEQKDTVEIDIEGDWSSAAFLLVAGAIAGDVTVSNLFTASKQADKAIVEVLKKAGAEIQVAGTSVAVKKSGLLAFEFDATDCPDLFPALSVLAACSRGESYIKGVHRLLNKESDRAESISEMLENFGVSFSIEDDLLCITGARQLRGTVINSYRDHRIAMAAAIGALFATSRVDIEAAEVVSKSYPSFFADLRCLRHRI